jgi:hypothetical protein
VIQPIVTLLIQYPDLAQIPLRVLYFLWFLLLQLCSPALKTLYQGLLPIILEELFKVVPLNNLGLVWAPAPFFQLQQIFLLHTPVSLLVLYPEFIQSRLLPADPKLLDPLH